MKTRWFVLAAMLAGCGGEPPADGGVSDAAQGDGGAADAGVDAAQVDGGADAGSSDAGGPDGGPDGGTDAGTDGGPPESDRLFDVAEIIEGLPPTARLYASFAGDAARDAISIVRDDTDLSLQRVTLYVNEAGVFRETATLTMTSFSAGVVDVSDFDGDGVRDIAVLRRDSPGRFWRVLYSAGDGTVAREEEIEGRGDRAGFADWNGDGKTDIALRQADGLADDLRLWMSNPTDDSRAFVDLGVTLTDGRFVAGDFDGDTRLDLFALPDQVYLQGAAGFGPAMELAACGGCGSAAAGDLNGDGRDDLVAAELRTGAEGTVHVFEANADGSFRTHATLTVDQPRRVVLADVDSDSELDIVVSDGIRFAAAGAKVFEVLFGDGLDFTGDRRRIGNDTTWEDVEVFDFDGDGNQDLVSNGRFVTYNEGGRALRAPSVSFWVGGSGGPRVARYDGDALPDAVFLQTGGDVQYRAMRADRTVGDAVDCTHPGPGIANQMLDVDGDGRLDMLRMLTSSDLDVWLNRGGCDLASVATSPIRPRQFGTKALDVTGDGVTDLVWREDDSLEVSPGLGSGVFGASLSSSVSAEWGEVLSGRVDAGSTPDLLSVSVSTDTVTVLLGDGDGSFTEGASVLVTALVAAYGEDADADGDVDLFSVARPTFDATIVSLHRNEDGVFAAPVTIATLSGFPQQVRPADFNGDGAADLLTVDTEIAEVFDLSGGAPMMLQRFPFTDSAQIVDADDDGDLDLVAHDERSTRNLMVVIRNRTVD
ncbi:MAG: FG-GAP repeat domain-containing protein [Sandaracinaceae bacterium]